MKRTALLMVTFLSLAACTTVEVRNVPQFSCKNEILLSKAALGISAQPSALTSSFVETDREVVAQLNCSNISGSHNVSWEWISPNGKSYLSSGPSLLTAPDNTYAPSGRVSHRLNISGEDAAELSGTWQVQAFLDNQPLATKRFTLAKLPELMEQVRSLTPVPPDENRYALVIGIEKYSETTAARFAARDAEIMKELFIRRFGVPERNVFTLVNEKATLGALRNQLGNKLYALPENSTLYVYYSGHGAPQPPQQGESYATPYIIPYDGSPLNLNQTGFSLQDFYGSLERLPAANVFVFLDSCFSGTVTGRYAEGKRVLAQGVKAVEMYVKDPAILSRKVVSISSSQNNQISNASERDKLGLFTSQLVRTLVTPDSKLRDMNVITVAALFDQLKQNVQSESLRVYGLSRKQTPTVAPAPLDSRGKMPIIGN